ncbi:MAG: DUF4838 domain-containing protein [Armatimonadetes bacterium]|nr:DUF4838 domain-containing protein [Armatimonadota bacterium]
MKFIFSKYITPVLIIVFLTGTGECFGMIWDPSADWGAPGSDTNPHGVWSYRESLSVGGSAYMMVGPFALSHPSFGAQRQFYSYTVIAKNTMTAPVWAFPGYYSEANKAAWVDAGQVWFDCTRNDGKKVAVLRWTAPYATSVTVRATFTGNHIPRDANDPGTTSHVYVLKNSSVIWSAPINGFIGATAPYYWPQKGTDPSHACSRTLDVNAGDTIDFACDYGDAPGLYSWDDCTGLVATITDELSVETDKLGELKSHPDNAIILVTAPKVVTVSSTTQIDGTSYIEEENRAAGIKIVLNPGLPAVWQGDHILVSGRMGTDSNGERYLGVTAISGQDQGSDVAPLGVGNKSLKLDTGLNMTGLLVKITGRVTLNNSGFLYVDDGSGLVDDNAYDAVGVRVVLDGLVSPPAKLPAEGDYVIVTGVAGLAKEEQLTMRVIRPRIDDDISTVSPVVPAQIDLVNTGNPSATIVVARDGDPQPQSLNWTFPRDPQGAGPNPNGVWTYGEESGSVGTALALMTGAWWPTHATWNFQYFAKSSVLGKNPYSSAPIWNEDAGHFAYLAPDQLGFEPGRQIFYGQSLKKIPVLRWTASSPGLLSVSALFSGNHIPENADDPGTTSHVYVVKNGSVLWDAPINGFVGCTINSNGVRTYPQKGPNPSQSYNGSIVVASGDTIDFACDYGSSYGTYNNDLTGLTLSMNLTAANSISCYAASELQSHVKKITGATLPIVTDDVNLQGTRILVGESAATAALGLHSSDFDQQEYLIKFMPNTLVLMGRDAQGQTNPGFVVDATVPSPYDDIGTCYAVYDFLERYCGVRWYLPTDFGLVCSSVSTLSATGTQIRRSPSMKCRYTATVYRMPADFSLDTYANPYPDANSISQRDMQMFALRQRFGGERYHVNHSFGVYDDQFAATHPDWFGQGLDQPAYANPGFQAQVVSDVRNYFDGNLDETLWGRIEWGATPWRYFPNSGVVWGDYYSLAPNDNSNWAVADAAYLNKPGGQQGYWGGYASDYVWGFANTIAGQVAQTNPGKYLTNFFYWDWFAIPSFPLHPNVAPSVTMFTRDGWFSQVWKDRYLKHLSTWGSQPGRRYYVWLYFNYPYYDGMMTSPSYRAFPGFFAHDIVKQMKLFHQAHVRGFLIEPTYINPSQSMRHGLWEALEMYVTFKLADDPTLDGNALIDEFFTKFYGAAAAPMEQLYDEIEAVWIDPANHLPNGPTGEALHWGLLGTQERMDHWAQLMQQAKAAAVTQIEKDRVAAFEGSIFNYMVAGRQAYLQQ